MTDGAGGIEHHDQAAAILAVDDDAGEGEHEHGRQGLKDANVPSAISEWVACRMYQATAAEFIPLPSMETTLARSTKRRARFCKMARISSTLKQ